MPARRTQAIEHHDAQRGRAAAGQRLSVLGCVARAEIGALSRRRRDAFKAMMVQGPALCPG